MKNNKNTLGWEIINYVSLALCIFGQMTVGYIYLVAQFAYLIANAVAVVRDFKIGLPKSNCVRDITFFTITLALIVLRFCGI